MHRRRFFKKGLLGAGLAVAGLAGCGKSDKPAEAGAAPGKKFKWNLVMTVPKTLKVWGTSIVEFADMVKKMSQGRLDIKVYGADELVPALETFNAVHRGQAEMGHGAAYYWTGKMPASVFFTAVPFGMSSNAMMAWLEHGGGQELWDELYAEHGVKPFPCGNSGCQMGGWFKKEINSLADFKGLKIRMPGLAGDVISAAGAQPVLLPAGEIFTSLQTGVIDAAEWAGPFHDYHMGFYKVTKFYYYGGWHEPGSVLEMIVNKKAWESLPEDLKLVLRAAISHTNSKIFHTWLCMDAEYYEKMKTEKLTQFREFPTDVLHELRRQATTKLLQISQHDAISKKIYDSFMAFQKRHENFQDVSDRAYLRTQKSSL